MRLIKAVSISVRTLTSVDLIEQSTIPFSLAALAVLFVLFFIVALCDFHDANIIKVRKVGLERTCNQLPFLQGISLRGYSRLFVSSFVSFDSVAVSTSNSALADFFLDGVYTICVVHHICYVAGLSPSDMIKFKYYWI